MAVVRGSMIDALQDAEREYYGNVLAASPTLFRAGTHDSFGSYETEVIGTFTYVDGRPSSGTINTLNYSNYEGEPVSVTRLSFDVAEFNEVAAQGDIFPALLAGNDYLYATGHFDGTVWGFAGNDRLYSGNAYQPEYTPNFHSDLHGGTGSDIYYVLRSDDGVFEEPGEGTDLVVAPISWTLGANVENLTLTGSDGIAGTGNALANVLRGNEGDNLLQGLAGNDTLNGGGGADSLYGREGADNLNGGTGNDRLYGQADPDRLYGNDGNDQLRGGAGRDMMTGGAGADNFIFDDGEFGGATAASADYIADFSSIEHDRIRLDAVDADLLVDGDQPFLFIGTDVFSHSAGELRFTVINGTTLVSGDVDGDGAADFMIRLQGTPTVSEGDFVL